MHLLKQQVQLYLEQVHSHQSQVNWKGNSHFVPFVKERDKMGRLIKNQFSSTKLIQVQQSGAKSPNKIKQKLQNYEHLMEEKMQKYFTYATSPNSTQLTKIKTCKKTIIQLISQRPLSKNTKKVNSSTSPTKQLVLLNKFTRSGNLNKTQSLFMQSSRKKDNLLIKRSHSSMLPSRKFSNSEKRQISPSAMSKRSSYFQPKITIQQNEAKYPQLSRLRKMKQLQVKLQSDFQQKHAQFLHKLIKSKQMAYQVKVGLDKIDQLC